MQFRVFPPLVEVFLLVEQPRQRLSHWSQALAPLDDAAAPPVATVDAYFDPTSNQAILGLRYDELALGPERLRFLVDLALLSEMGMIQPAELSEGDRTRFVGERLARCTVHVADQRKVVSALVELVRRVREHRAASWSAESVGSALERPRPARGDTADPLLLFPKGTRTLGSPGEAALPSPTRELARGSTRQPKLVLSPPEASDAVPQSELKRVVSEPIMAPAPRPDPPPRDERRRSSPHVIARSGVHRATTVTMSPADTQRMIEASNASLEAPEREATADPFLPTTKEPPAGGMIFGRYQRNGRWVPVRIGSLSLKGATLMAGAMPRVDDRVEIALSFASHRGLVRGLVAKVSTMQEAEASGATTFSVKFELDDAARRQLTALLTAARAARVTLMPPPPRSTRRYPVEWPICLGTTWGAVRAEALDVSTAGMFAKPLHPLTVGGGVTFTVLLDDGLSPVSGRARVVRCFTEADAKAVGLSAGYGLAILDMPEPERERWYGFVGRIEKRASKRVLIGAAPGRLAELQSSLVAAGYAVTSGTSPGDIVQLASTEGRSVDAALIDATWLDQGRSPSEVESLFTGRNVPCVTMQGDARRARIAIDRLLAVV